MQVMQRTISACLALLQAHRAHEVVDAALLRSVLCMLRDLGVYMQRFHAPCLAGADSAYTARGQELAEGGVPVASALTQAEGRLAEEEARAREFLGSETLEPMLAVVKQRLLEEHMQTYISRGLGDLLEQQRHEDLARMYRLACALLIGSRHRVPHPNSVQASSSLLPRQIPVMCPCFLRKLSKFCRFHRDPHWAEQA